MDAEGWDERYAGTELVWGHEPNRWVAAEMADAAPATALDVACGEGRNAIWLAKQGWQVTGIDFSAAGLERARLLAEEAGVAARTTWQRLDVVRDQYPAGPFAAVIVCYLQLVEAERRQALQRAARAVAPGGLLLVVAHDRANLEDGVGGPQDPTVLYTADDVVADLRGFDELVVERAQRVRRPVETPDGERSAIDLVVRMHSRAAG